jgi:hypothetical protein
VRDLTRIGAAPKTRHFIAPSGDEILMAFPFTGSHSSAVLRDAVHESLGIRLP